MDSLLRGSARERRKRAANLPLPPGGGDLPEGFRSYRRYRTFTGPRLHSKITVASDAST